MEHGCKKLGIRNWELGMVGLAAVGSNPWRSVKIRGWFFSNPFLSHGCDTDETRIEVMVKGSWLLVLKFCVWFLAVGSNP
jgi:hypothetical protein